MLFASISCCWDTHVSFFPILLVSFNSSIRSKHSHAPFKHVVATKYNANSSGGFFFSFPFPTPFFWRQVNISAGAGHPDNSVSQLTGEVTRAKHCVTVPHGPHLGPARHPFCLFLTILAVRQAHQHPADCAKCTHSSAFYPLCWRQQPAPSCSY